MHLFYLFEALFVRFSKGMLIQGGYLLILKPSEYDTLVSIGAFKGIKVSYDIDPSSGNYQMKLNSADWSVFQVNLGATGSVWVVLLMFRKALCF
jgi:hypothetical protein